MLESISAVIEESWKLFNEGEVEGALQLITTLEERESFSPELDLRCQTTKGMYNLFLGNYDLAIEIGENAYKESLKQDKPLLAIDALCIAFWGLYMRNRFLKAGPYAKLCEELLKSVMHEPQFEFEKSQVHFYLIDGVVKEWTGKLDLAIENYKKALLISKNHDSLYYTRALSLRLLGGALTTKGEYGLALDSFNEALKYLKGNSKFVRMQKAGNFHDIAYINALQGDLESSKILNERSLDIILKSSETPMAYIGFNYVVLINIHLQQNFINKAKEYLQEFQRYDDKLPLTANKNMIKLCKAMILKSSTRIQDWTESMNILRGLISNNTLILYAIPELCGLYLRELQITNDPKILDDCQPLADKLLSITQNINIYYRAWANLLQGKISLLKMNLGDARRYLTKAQETAEKHGLQLLAQEISQEHDKLLEKLGEWEKLENQKAPYADRMDLALLEHTIEGILGKRGIKPPELVNEEPLLLSIFEEGGLLLFSYAFTEEWERDNELFGSFLSAFTSFSYEFFSEGLERVKFGNHTVLMDSLNNFSICFLFSGQSYQAKKKLTRFVDHLKENNNIQEALNKYHETSQVLDLKKFPFLKSLISEIFIK